MYSVFQVFNGYFVHFFAPENMDPIPKNILFVIDVSGSMWGVKMKQVSSPIGSDTWDPGLLGSLSTMLSFHLSFPQPQRLSQTVWAAVTQ